MAKPLYAGPGWRRLRRELAARPVNLFLDYDGTLTPIVATPELARLPGRNRELLQALRDAPGCRVAIISGRALADLKGLVGLRGLVYSGNHGYELEGADLHLGRLVPPRTRALLRSLKRRLAPRLRGLRGVRLEDKGVTLSVHYRQARPQDLPRLREILEEVAGPSRERREIRITAGKKVFEIRPPVKWDKGKIVKRLLRSPAFSRRGALPVFIGDDVTDEDAFRALNSHGLTIAVGRRQPTQAEYFLRNTREVTGFLGRLLKLVRARGAARP